MRLRWIVTLLLALAPSTPACASSVKVALVQLSAARVGDYATMLAEARTAKAAYFRASWARISRDHGQ